MRRLCNNMISLGRHFFYVRTFSFRHVCSFSLRLAVPPICIGWTIQMGSKNVPGNDTTWRLTWLILLVYVWDLELPALWYYLNTFFSSDLSPLCMLLELRFHITVLSFVLMPTTKPLEYVHDGVLQMLCVLSWADQSLVTSKKSSQQSLRWSSNNLEWYTRSDQHLHISTFFCDFCCR
jgi:hypothetical protein